jgi:murein DD-endopeptidase MepM/ murein hydrolase activator NlpD
MKKLAIFVFSTVVVSLLTAQPAHSYRWKGFQGYFIPVVLVSPMQDDIPYTPVGKGLVSSNAGFRRHPVTGKHSFHSGVDLKANLNDKVYCLLDGIVTRVGWRGNLGVAVEVYHPYPNILTICGHLNAYSVRPGEFVQRGRVLGYAGSTGRSTGVHVHYTVKRYDTKELIDPFAFIKQVPQYAMALKSARARDFAQKNAENFKIKTDTNSKDEDPDDDEDGSSEKEVEPPDPDSY